MELHVHLLKLSNIITMKIVCELSKMGEDYDHTLSYPVEYPSINELTRDILASYEEYCLGTGQYTKNWMEFKKFEGEIKGEDYLRLTRRLADYTNKLKKHIRCVKIHQRGDAWRERMEKLNTGIKTTQEELDVYDNKLAEFPLSMDRPDHTFFQTGNFKVDRFTEIDSMKFYSLEEWFNKHV
jgi:hypothetical protein